MTFTLRLSPDIAKNLDSAAQSQGVTPADYALQVLARDLADQAKRREAVDLLQSWIDKGTQWLQRLTSGGIQIIIPEITDYEVRRELIRGGMPASIAKLDQLAGVYRYLPVTIDAWRQAAEFWAVVRNLGRPAAGDQRLD